MYVCMHVCVPLRRRRRRRRRWYSGGGDADSVLLMSLILVFVIALSHYRAVADGFCIQDPCRLCLIAANNKTHNYSGFVTQFTQLTSVYSWEVCPPSSQPLLSQLGRPIRMCIFRSRCSMDMWCLGGLARDNWVWVLQKSLYEKAFPPVG